MNRLVNLYALFDNDIMSVIHDRMKVMVVPPEGGLEMSSDPAVLRTIYDEDMDGRVYLLTDEAHVRHIFQFLNDELRDKPEFAEAEKRFNDATCETE